MNSENNLKEKTISTTNIEEKSNTNTEDDELLKIFIGKNYEKIIKNKFNFAFFFLQFVYLFYRKMYLLGFVFFFINFLVFDYVKNKTVAYILIITFLIVMGFLINKIYLNKAKRKIEKIKKDNDNIETIKKVCLKKGGTSISSVILFITLLLIISIIGLLIYSSFIAGQLSFNIFDSIR